jgi:hypothetical protein
MSLKLCECIAEKVHTSLIQGLELFKHVWCLRLPLLARIVNARTGIGNPVRPTTLFPQLLRFLLGALKVLCYSSEVPLYSCHGLHLSILRSELSERRLHIGLNFLRQRLVRLC